jgi:tRNA threonylcarbamoyladenosine biosynthesis protein TsaE
MGAGKTTLISRIAALLGAEDSVTSPTFAIVNQYEGTKHTIYHFDMYRIERVEEALDFGSEEYLSSGDLCLVEWPEKIEPLLPDDTMVVRIEILSDTARRFEIQ